MAFVFVLPSFPGEHSWGRQSCPSQGLQRCRGCRDDAAQLSPPGTIWWIPALSHGTGASLGRRCGAPASHSETLTLSQNRMGWMDLFYCSAGQMEHNSLLQEGRRFTFIKEICIWRFPLWVCVCWAPEGRPPVPRWWWSWRVVLWWWQGH